MHIAQRQTQTCLRTRKPIIPCLNWRVCSLQRRCCKPIPAVLQCCIAGVPDLCWLHRPQFECRGRPGGCSSCRLIVTADLSSQHDRPHHTMIRYILLCLLAAATIEATTNTKNMTKVNKNITNSKALRFVHQFLEKFKIKYKVAADSPKIERRLPDAPFSPTTKTTAAAGATNHRIDRSEYYHQKPVIPEPVDFMDCIERPKQWKFGNHWYFYSKDNDPSHPPDQIGKLNWYEAFKTCRRHCMDPVNIDTEEEWYMVRDFIERKKSQYTWTSGRKCDFEKCDTLPGIEPNIINGWFWLGNNAKLSPTDKPPVNPNGTVWKEQPWLERGDNASIPQPDNTERYRSTEAPESCLGIIWRAYKVDRVGWHDIACYHKKHVMCEDNDLLLRDAYQAFTKWNEEKQNK